MDKIVQTAGRNDLGTTLPRNDEQITTSAGDIILYQGNQITVYYAENSWNFTRLGRIDDPSGLREALGGGDVDITFSLADRAEDVCEGTGRIFAPSDDHPGAGTE